MKQLSKFKLNKYNEVFYIKKFINGMSKKDWKDFLNRPLIGGFMSILVGVECLKENEKLGIKRYKN